jgi:hypothetical protein
MSKRSPNSDVLDLLKKHDGYLLTVSTVHTLTGLPNRSICNLCKNGAFPGAFQFPDENGKTDGKKWYIPLGGVRKYLPFND